MAATKRRILVIEDDPKTVELVTLYLERDGYEVHSARDGLEGLKQARELVPDLVVLDLMLPGLDGFSVCRILREESGVPVIMLTARTMERDKLEGLGMGADDYVTKPFSPRELAARVRAVLRRLPGERGPEEISFGPINVNFLRREASLEGRPLNLTSAEFKLLGILVREPGRVFSRPELIEKALGFNFEGFDRTIDVHILNLRRKLEPDPRRPSYIKTVYGAGYKLSGGES